MNKHLKLFANHTAYEAAKNNIDKPNVVMCQQEDEVHFNPVSIITFRLNNSEFQAEEGMTWGEFVNSSYNSGDFDINNNYARYLYYNIMYLAESSMRGAQSTDVISSSINYFSE